MYRKIVGVSTSEAKLIPRLREASMIDGAWMVVKYPKGKGTLKY